MRGLTRSALRPYRRVDSRRAGGGDARGTGALGFDAWYKKKLGKSSKQNEWLGNQSLAGGGQAPCQTLDRTSAARSHTPRSTPARKAHWREWD